MALIRKTPQGEMRNVSDPCAAAARNSRRRGVWVLGLISFTSKSAKQERGSRNHVHVMDRSGKQPKSSSVQKMPFGLFKGHRGAALVRKPDPTTFSLFADVDARV